ncbi:hypothetical protein [Streptomyces sviceus]|uniref:hypothetical protein n=1 Tax=Streptomyces sviceus TaxID=285530 RepID=UPI0033250228
MAQGLEGGERPVDLLGAAGDLGDDALLTLSAGAKWLSRRHSTDSGSARFFHYRQRLNPFLELSSCHDILTSGMQSSQLVCEGEFL